MATTTSSVAYSNVLTTTSTGSTIPEDVTGVVGIKKNPSSNIAYSQLLTDTNISNRAFKYSDNVYTSYPGLRKADLQVLKEQVVSLQSSQYDVEASPISLQTFLQLQCLKILQEANQQRKELRQRLQTRPNLSYYTKYRKSLWLLDEWFENHCNNAYLVACLQLLLLPFVLLLFPVMIILDICCCCRCCCNGNQMEQDFIRELIRDFPVGNTVSIDAKIREDLQTLRQLALDRNQHYEIEIACYQEDIGTQHVTEREVDMKVKHRLEDRFVIWYREKTSQEITITITTD